MKLLPEGEYIIPPICHQPNILTVTDASGYFVQTKEQGSLLDLGSGYWYASLGHKLESVRHALQQGFNADLFTCRHQPAEDLAKILCGELGYACVIPLTSGSEAVDTAMRIAAQCTAKATYQIKGGLLSLHRSYHGSSTVGLQVNGCTGENAWIRQHPATRAIRSWVFNPTLTEAQALQHLANEPINWQEISAFIFEPVQGVGGIRVLNPLALKVITERCQREGVVVIADEVTTGMGRTGYLANTQTLPEDLRPDILVLGKALTNGEFPLSAVLLSRKVVQLLERSSEDPRTQVAWGTTMGGQPAGCLAALAVCQTMLADGFLEGVRNRAERFDQLLRSQLNQIGQISELRNCGMMFGLVLKNAQTCKMVVGQLYEAGYRTIDEGRVLSLAPFLTLPDELFEGAVETLKRVMQRI